MKTITLNDLIIPKHDELLFDILDHKHTHYVLYGGRGGVKSSFISIVIPLLLTQNKEAHAVVFRKVANTLRDSVYSQMCFGIELLGLSSQFKFTISPMEITYKKTGQKILFRGLDQKEKIKSIKAPFGYFGITWFEELDQFHGREEIRNVLQSTMRGKGGVFWNFESFNPPISASNWANKELLDNSPDRMIVKSCYLDTPKEWLSETFFDEADKLKIVNEKAYRHEYLGEAVGTGGNVFENIIIPKEGITDEQIATFDRLYYGCDFGYFPDPWAFVKCHYDATRRKLYIFDESVEYKKNNRETADILLNKGLTKADLLIADSAEPKSIADYVEYGLYVRSAEKGPGSVNYSMKWLQGLTEIIIDNRRCPRAAKEFLTYEYERTKDNEIISGYPDKNNHLIDAARYALNLIWRSRGK